MYTVVHITQGLAGVQAGCDTLGLCEVKGTEPIFDYWNDKDAESDSFSPMLFWVVPERAFFWRGGFSQDLRRGLAQYSLGHPYKSRLHHAESRLNRFPLV